MVMILNSKQLGTSLSDGEVVFLFTYFNDGVVTNHQFEQEAETKPLTEGGKKNTMFSGAF